MVLRDPLTQAQLYELYFKVIALVGTLVTFISGTITYFKLEKEKVAAAEKAHTAQVNAQNEALFVRVWSERVKVYDQAAAAAACVATTFRLAVTESDALPAAASPEQRLDEYLAARQVYFQLYWGNLSLLEDRSVEAAMVKFGEAVREADALLGLDALNAVGEQPAKGSESDDQPVAKPVATNKTDQAFYLEKLSYHLAHVFRGSLIDTWNPNQTFEPLFGQSKEIKTENRSDRSYGAQALALMHQQPRRPEMFR